MKSYTVHSSKEQGLVLKLDYEKAFDFVNLDFLIELLKLRGFRGQMDILDLCCH